ncbi:MAG: hypothetical protein A2Y33_08300 [Spirochaetes bacterium GWF1_51_8]|nr:MAG: hypothetical protein A2Y33_08300 [Spirochaetes bacterium GWF1_51_8]
MFRNVSLVFRIVFSFIIVSIAVFVLGYFGITSTTKLDGVAKNLDHSHTLNSSLITREVEHMKWAQTVLLAVHSKSPSIAVEKDPTKCNLGKWYYGEERKDIEKTYPALKPFLEKLEAPHKSLHQSVVKIEEYLSAGEWENASELFNSVTLVSLKSVQEQLASMRGILSSNIAQNNKDQKSISSQSLTQTYLAMGIGGFITLLLGLFVSFSLSRLTGKIKRGVNELDQNALQLTGASGQISDSGEQLSAGTSRLASSIEEMSASLEELQAGIQANSNSINETRVMTGRVAQSAEENIRQMEEMIASMNEIVMNNGRIGKIIKVIDDIAFQTNILALNAAVEAARAGESGRGFAVVAEQVKSLAQKSAEAAQETAALIEKAVEGVNGGQKISHSVKESIVSTGELTQKINTVIREIDKSSQEQLKGATQINQAVADINMVMQTTVTLSEENAAAGEQLNSQALSLKEIVVDLKQIVSNKQTGQLSAEVKLLKSV